MKLSNQAIWDEFVRVNTDDYSAAIVQFARAWAELMEKRIEHTDTVASCFKQTAHEADTVGLSGFMYSCAVGVLAQCWIYGEELRRAHNRDTQIGTEGDRANETGGVLNTALLNIQ